MKKTRIYAVLAVKGLKGLNNICQRGVLAHLKRVSPCPLLWWLVAQTAVSLWFSSPALVPCLLDFLPMLVQSPTSPGGKREAL